MIALRPYQTACVDSVERELSRHRSTLVVMCTGSGKTSCLAELAKRSPGRVLLLADRVTIVEQIRERLLQHAVPEAKFEVSTVQSMVRRLGWYQSDHFALIIVDESHHIVSNTYRQVCSHFTSAKIAGFTATPDRRDGAMLGSVFASVAYRYGVATAQREGWVVPVEAYSVRCHPSQLPQLLATYAAGRQTIAFCESVEAAKVLANQLRLLGYQAQAIDGSQSELRRRITLEAFSTKQTQFLCNMQLLTEGVDLPCAEVIALVRSQGARATRAQMVGRGLRPAPGKTRCTVFDFVGDGSVELAAPQDALAGSVAFPDGQRLEPGTGVVRVVKQKPSLLRRFWRLLNWRLW